jgi:hypothetical protein
VQSVHQALKQNAVFMQQHSERLAQNLGFDHRVDGLGKVSLESMTLNSFAYSTFQQFEIFANEAHDNVTSDGPRNSKVENHIAKNSRRIFLVFWRRVSKLFLDRRQDLARVHLVGQGQNPDFCHGADGPLKGRKGFSKGIHLVGHRVKDAFICRKIILKDAIGLDAERQARIKGLRRTINDGFEAHGQETIPCRLFGNGLLLHVGRVSLLTKSADGKQPILRTECTHLEKTFFDPETTSDPKMIETAFRIRPVKEPLCETDGYTHGALDGTIAL